MLDADKILERMEEISDIRINALQVIACVRVLVEEINRELEALKPKTAESFLEE